MSSQQQKSSNPILVGVSSFLLGLTTCALFISVMNKIGEQEKKKPLSKQPDNEGGTLTRDDLLKEQLSRGEKFLGKENQEKLSSSFVIVVGVGGVGSNCAHFLLRSGVRRIRVVDFDNVTLSSLNRHAVATREDVGISKVQVLKKHFNKILPECLVECEPVMCTQDNVEFLLRGKPDYVVDCIDDRNTKVALLAYCIKNNIRVLASMGAGCKSDPTRLHFAEFRDVIRDPLASRLRWNLKQYLKDDNNTDLDFDRIEVLYSSEETEIKLLPLDEEVAGEDPSELGTVPNFRVRILPVLGTMPAIFGMAMAARVVTTLANQPFRACPRPSLKTNSIQRYYQKLGNRLKKLNEKRPDDEKWTTEFVDIYDVEALVVQFAQRCAVTQRKLGGGGAFELTVWRYDKPVRADNLVFCSSKGLEQVEKLLLDKQLPSPSNLGISEFNFSRIVQIHAGLRTKEVLDSEAKQSEKFDLTVSRAIDHMNDDHSEDCLTLVQAYAGLPEADTADLVRMDRLGMDFECVLQNGEKRRSRVLFPSRLVQPGEIRGDIVRMTLQGRKMLSKDD